MHPLSWWRLWQLCFLLLAFFFFDNNVLSVHANFRVSSVPTSRVDCDSCYTTINPARVHLMTFDSRPFLPDTFELPSGPAAVNAYYASKIGASFAAYYAPAADPQNPRNSAGCKNSQHGTLRSPSWCKLLAVWAALQKNPECNFFVFIDSDAIFLRSNVSVISRHLEQL